VLSSWILTRHDDVVAGLLDPRFANDRIAASMAALPPELREPGWREHMTVRAHPRLTAQLVPA